MPYYFQSKKILLGKSHDFTFFSEDEKNNDSLTARYILNDRHENRATSDLCSFDGYFVYAPLLMEGE